MSATLDTLKLRRPLLEYVAPPICEIVFSTTASPVIVLEDLKRLLPPSGFVLGGLSGFRLSWNAYPGALCYNVYSVNGTTYTLVFECVTDTFVELPGPGVYVVTVVTLDGESDVNLSQRIDATGAGPAPVITVIADPGTTVEGGDTPGAFKFIRSGLQAGNITVKFGITGTATHGVDYNLTATTTLDTTAFPNCTVTMPDSVGEVWVYVEGLADADIEVGGETVIATLQTSSNYAVGSPDSATVTIEDCTAAIFDTGLYPVGSNTDEFRLSDTGFVAGQILGLPYVPKYFNGGSVSEATNEVDSSPILGTQSGNTLTTDAPFFGSGDVGKIIVYGSGEIVQITAFTGVDEVEVVPARTVPATTFIMRTSPITLPGLNGVVNAINEAGQMAGEIFAGVDLFWFDAPNNVYQTIVAGVSSADIGGISEDGWVALQYFSAGVWSSYLFDPTGPTLTNLGTLGTDALCQGINDSHNVGMTFHIGTTFHAGKYIGGVLTDIHPAFAQISDTRSINEANELVGTYTENAAPFENGVFFHNGTTTVSIGSLGGETNLGHGRVMNDSGVIVGSVESGAGTNIFLPFYWSQAGGMTLIPLLGGTTQGLAHSINNQGWIVGQMSGELFLFRDGITERVADLPEVAGSGWTFVGDDTCKITDSGYLIGHGVKAGNHRLFLLKLC